MSQDSPRLRILLYSGAMTFRRADLTPTGLSRLRRHALGSTATRTAVAFLGVLTLYSAVLRAGPLTAQATNDDLRVRVGLTTGGIGLFGASVEFIWGSRSLDVGLATFSFSDVSLAVTGKQYFGGGDLRPFVGLGLWGAAGSTGQEGQQTGKALILRIPVGADWNFTGRNHLGGSLSVNEGLWIDRADPEDDTPINHRPIPLPGFYYRFEP